MKKDVDTNTMKRERIVVSVLYKFNQRACCQAHPRQSTCESKLQQLLVLGWKELLFDSYPVISYICTYIYIYIYVCVCVYMYMSAYMNIYTSTRSNENDENTYGQQKEITRHGK